MFAFDNTWEVLALLGGIVALRVALPRLPALHRQRGAILEFVDSGLVAVLLVFCILRPFVIQAFYIPSGSMESTLQINDRILVNKFIYYFREPQFGDVVVFRPPPYASPGKKEKDFIKRVVGLPGDRIAVHNGYLYVNGERKDEPYIKELHSYSFPQRGRESVFFTLPGGMQLGPFPLTDGKFVVPPDTVFVMGDNRNDSNDSHRWGPLPRENVLGKAFCIFWPPYRIGLIRSAQPTPAGPELGRDVRVRRTEPAVASAVSQSERSY